jgi:hypothetical protein
MPGALPMTMIVSLDLLISRRNAMWAKAAVIVGFGLAVWAFCGALIGVGRQFMSMEATLVVHAIGAPLGAAFFSWLFHRKFGYTRPIVTAAAFVTIALALDVFVVALMIEGNFGMFTSAIGVWIPQVLIFLAAWLTGNLVESGKRGDLPA